MAGRESRQAAFARRLNRLFGGAAALIAVLMLAIWAIGPRSVAAFALRSAANLAGAGPVAFEITEAGWRGLAAEHVALGADKSIRAARISIGFGALGPFGGVRRAEVVGLRVEERLDGAAEGGGPASFALPPLVAPFPVTLTDTAIRIAAPGALYSAEAPGRVVFAKEGGQGAFALAITPQSDVPGAFMLHRGSLDLSAGAVTIALAPVGPAVAGKAQVTVFARITPPESGRAAAVTLGLHDVVLPAMGAALKTLELTGKIDASAEQVALTLHDCARIEGLVVKRLRADSLPVCPGTDGKPALAFALGGDRDLALDVVVRDAQGRYLDEKGAPLLSGRLPVVAASGRGASDLSSWKGVLTATGGMMIWGTSVAVSGLDLKADASAEAGRLAHLDATLAAAQLTDPRPKPLIAPLALTGKSETRGSGLVFTANAAGAGIAALIHAEGTYDLSAGTGEAKIALAPLSFDPAGLKPETLMPGLAGQVSEAKGKIAAEGTVSWKAGAMSSRGRLQLGGLAARLPLARVEGLQGNIDFASLLPLATAAPQSLRVALLDLGLPLTDGQIRLSVDPSGDARIHEARWTWLGGTVGLSEALFSPFRETQSLTLAIKSIDLSQLLTLADVKNLSGTGKLSGSIPVTLERGRQPVHDGRLAADPPGGTIVYKTGGVGAGGPTSPAAILHTALDDFRYDSLTAEISGDLAGALSVQVHLKGRNPQLYDGRRIELNVSTEGAFVDMLRKGLGGYRGAVQP